MKEIYKNEVDELLDRIQKAFDSYEDFDVKDESKVNNKRISLNRKKLLF